MTNSAVVLVVDRLGAGCLGPYGNTWAPTPNFNALAAKSLLLDNCLTDSPDVLEAYRGYWQGRHALERNGDGSALASIAAVGVETTLVTDDSQLAESAESDAFEHKLLLELPAPSVSAEAIEETAAAGFFGEAMGVLESQREPFLLWIHARGLAAPWDAPMALRQSLAAEEDPDPLQSVAAPSRRLEPNYDPDELLGITQACAAQVAVLDACLGVFLDAIERIPNRDRLLTIVASPRGFPLGQHLVVGDQETQLYGETLHVPLALWRGDGQGALRRNHALAQPPDVAATLLDWFDVATGETGGFAQSLLPLTDPATADASPLAGRDCVVSVADGEISMRTPAWFLRQATGEESVNELYCKPDDRWELNEVASRCPQIVEGLSAAIEAYKSALSDGSLATVVPLAEELRHGTE